MGLFGRRRKNSGKAGLLTRDPFDVVPFRPENVEIRHDSAGNAHLRMWPELKGLRKKIADVLGYDYSRKVQLDGYGTMYFKMADGANRLRDIADRMAADSGRDRKEVDEGVILFTKKLMTMNMIALRVADRRNGELREQGA